MATSPDMKTINAAMVKAKRTMARKAEINPPVLRAKAATAARIGATHPKPTAT
jgi:hypothetical protein